MFLKLILRTCLYDDRGKSRTDDGCEISAVDRHCRGNRRRTVITRVANVNLAPRARCAQPRIERSGTGRSAYRCRYQLHSSKPRIGHSKPTPAASRRKVWSVLSQLFLRSVSRLMAVNITVHLRTRRRYW